MGENVWAKSDSVHRKCIKLHNLKPLLLLLLRQMRRHIAFHEEKERCIENFGLKYQQMKPLGRLRCRWKHVINLF
jgi:hypothetical protein